jgi:hypothetical protein
MLTCTTACSRSVSPQRHGRALPVVRMGHRTGSRLTFGWVLRRARVAVRSDVAHRLQVPDDSLDLTGPAGGAWIIGTGEPIAHVRADAVAYMRALAGRDPGVAVDLVSGHETTLPLIRQARVPS